MSDNLEKFIQENRPGFDDRQPGEKVWQMVNHHLEQKQQKAARRISIWRYTRIAAASVLLIGTGVLIGLNFQNKSSQEIAVYEQFPEYSEAELFYKKEVKIKEAQLANYNYDPAIYEDLRQLDKIYEELKKELSEAPKSKQEQVINALITNYRTKISILERVLERIQINKQENLKTTKNDSTEI
jgi:hypothetical protein